MQSLQELHPDESDDTLISGVGREAMEEMRQMQFQPMLMDNYRRYVLIKAKKEPELNDRTETLECVPLGEFKFRDDAFDSGKKR
ncbi:hypothetical protein QCA50_001577 [Cerrena zonata]|uniref:Uncharacterized protein n=1 Tax=Cerrena zonata TaxID=2478898 RepID=A0AAW0GNP7_9APHY